MNYYPSLCLQREPVPLQWKGQGVSHWSLRFKIQSNKNLINQIKKKYVSLYTVDKIILMETLKEILLITIPALLVLITAWLMIRGLLKNDQNKRREEMVLQNSRTVTPIKLQAYERIVLFLERISLESLLVRVSTNGMNASRLHSALLTTIRSEFEHNLSQQIYMSPQAWEVVRNARSNMIKIINSSFEKLPETASGMELSKHLLEAVMEMDKEPTRAAIEYIKGEVGRMI